MRLTRSQFADWRNLMQNRINEINAHYGYIFGDDLYYFSHRGKRHRLVLMREDKIVAVKIEHIQITLDLELQRIKKGY